jgi:NADH dehydrogenase
MTADQVELLARDNVVSAEAIKDGRTLQGLGVEPQSIEAIVPTYLYRYRKTGQYQAQRLEA